MFDFTIPFLPTHRKAWLVGGAIRDMLLGNAPTDIDIIVDGNAAEYARQLAQNIGSRAIELGKAPFFIYRVRGRGLLFDVAGLNGPSIKADLLQRDFSINALAWQLPDNMLIDEVGGCRDLAQKSIRMVSDTVFRADPIRLLRAFRLTAVLRFKIEAHTLTVMEKEAHLIKVTAAERVQSELLKILAEPDAAETVKALHAANLLQHILPEVAALAQCRQNRYHDFDVFDHTLAALAALDRLLASPDVILPQSTHPCIVPNNNHPENLKLAMLLHDIGKPATRTIGPDGGIHFFTHEKIGAQMTEAIARRLVLSNARRQYITFIVAHHLRPTLLFNAHQKGDLSRRAIIKLFRKSQEFTPDLFLHAMADNAGKKATSGSLHPASAFVNFACDLLNDYFQEFKPAQKLPGLITGEDLINTFHLSPSPSFKIILDAVEQGRLEGRLNNKADAMEWIKTFLSKNRLNHSS